MEEGELLVVVLGLKGKVVMQEDRQRHLRVRLVFGLCVALRPYHITAIHRSNLFHGLEFT